MPLTAEQSRELQDIIERRRAELHAEVGEDLDRVRAERLSDMAGAAPDAGDESVASLISDLNQADASRDLLELAQLDAAHQRIENGTYGVCTSCGQDIGYERLKANPAAGRCIRCQTQFEKTHASQGGSTL